jgi:hypothetical protein
VTPDYLHNLTGVVLYRNAQPRVYIKYLVQLDILSSVTQYTYLAVVSYTIVLTSLRNLRFMQSLSTPSTQAAVTTKRSNIRRGRGEEIR